MSSKNSSTSNEISTQPPSSPLLRRVMIMATGSRGDIQPYVAIGIALKRKGCAVRVLTHPSPTHTKLCADFGLEHVSFGTDVDAFMRDDKDARTVMETGDTIKFFACVADIIKNNTDSFCKPFCDEVITGSGENRPDLLIVSFLNRFFGLYARHVLKIPTIEIMLQYWVFDDPSRAPMGMPTLLLGLHKLIHTKLMIPQDYNNFKRFDDCIATILASKATGDSTPMPLPRLEDFLPYEQWYDSEVNHSPLLPLLVAQPPMFKEILCPTLPEIPLSPNPLRYVGPAIIEPIDQIDGEASSFGGDASKKKLEDFLASDTKRQPIYMGWGSMIRKSTHEMVLYAVDVLQKSRQRGIVLGGLAGLSMELLKEALVEYSAKDYNEQQKILQYARENILFVDKAPHEWLFPQVSLTVHHGGAGTLNASLRAGVPTIVTPVFGDQYDNSLVVKKMKVGFGFANKLQNIGASDLSKIITAVLKDPTVKSRAKHVGTQLRNSNENDGGCGVIVKEIETYWREIVASGKFLADVSDWDATVKEKKARCSENQTLRTRVALVSAVAAAIVAIIVALAK